MALEQKNERYNSVIYLISNIQIYRIQIKIFMIVKILLGRATTYYILHIIFSGNLYIKCVLSIIILFSNKNTSWAQNGHNGLKKFDYWMKSKYSANPALSAIRLIS